MGATFRAVQVREPGVLECVERPVPQPGRDEVLVAVEACGVCGADAGDIDAARPGTASPRIPGHEVVGRIVQAGPDVAPPWTSGTRVGVGRLGGHCNRCRQCRRGQFQVCENQQFVGSTRDGGYAELMVARATGLVAIPPELDAVHAAPILCAGIATFNALKHSGAGPGDRVAIHGLGGLGHMALQYARRMGFEVIAVGRGHGKAADAASLGAHHYIDAGHENAGAKLRTMGGAQAIVTTVTAGVAVAALLPGLVPRGRLIVLAGGKEPLAISAGALVVGELAVQGSITGSPQESERALAFSLLTGVRPWIETYPLDRAQEAIDRMRSGQARYRIVLTMASNPYLQPVR